MNTIKKITILFLIAACGREHKSNLSTKNLDWLNGDWKNTSDGTLINESWNIINDTLMQGESFTIEQGDTVSHETMQIKIEGNKMLFVPTVDNQNNGQPVVFTLTDSKNNLFVFKNPEHDFPQTIAYQKINNDSLCAYIEGTMKGKVARIDFSYKRVK